MEFAILFFKLINILVQIIIHCLKVSLRCTKRLVRILLFFELTL